MVLLKRVAALDDKNVRGYLNSRILPEAGGMPNPAVDLSMTVAEEQIEKHTVQMKVKHMVKRYHIVLTFVGIYLLLIFK